MPIDNKTILKELEKLSLKRGNPSKNFKLYTNLIIENTSFLDHKNPSIAERVYCILHVITKEPTCQICDTIVNKWCDKNIGYRKTCSHKCSHLLKNKTSLDKYGNICSLQNKEVKEKSNKTKIEKYGTIHPLQNKEIKEKIKITNLERYGFKSPVQNEEVKEKMFQTNLEKYGNKCTLKNQTIVEKRNNTNQKRYNCDYPFQNKEILQKTKDTLINTYGVDNPAKSKFIYNKIKETNIKKYGFETPTQNEEIKEKIKISNEKTCFERFGVKSPFENPETQEKIQKTNMEKYGNLVPSKTNIIKEKIKNKNIQTNQLKHGVDFNSQKHINNFSDFNPEYLKENFVNNKNSLLKNAIKKHYNILSDDTINRFIKANKEEFIGIKTRTYTTELEIREYIHETLTSYIEELNLNNNSNYPNPLTQNITYSFTMLSNYRKILAKQMELDIYFEINAFIIDTLPQEQHNITNLTDNPHIKTLLHSKKIAIEYNGLMFHSFGKHTQKRFNNAEKEELQKNKHLQKTIECEQNGIQLFHINENEWVNPIKQNIWKHILKQSIYNFNTTYIETLKPEQKHIIKVIEKTKQQQKIIYDFLNNNSLEGYKKSDLQIGIFDLKTNELLSIATFELINKQPNTTKELQHTQIKLVNYCNKIIQQPIYTKHPNYDNFKSLQKILLFIFRNENILKSPFLTLSHNNNNQKIGIELELSLDRRWNSLISLNENKTFKQFGFSFVSTTKPNNYYFFGHNVFNIYKKLNIKKMIEHNKTYRTFYDCGNLLFNIY
jgi:hypothetical protein